MRRRELVVGSIVASLLLFGVLFLGPPDEPPRRDGPPSSIGATDRESERPARQKPVDPRRPTERKSPTPEAPRPDLNAGAAVSRPVPEATFLSLRVVDAGGQAQPGIPIDVFASDPTTGPARRLASGVVSVFIRTCTLRMGGNGAINCARGSAVFRYPKCRAHL